MAAILVHIDLDGDRPHASSLAALAAGRHVASAWGATLYACVVLHDPHERFQLSIGDAPPQRAELEALETALALAGADKVVLALTPAPVAPLWACVGSAWQAVLDHLRPRLVLFGADAPSTPELGPRTGARIGARLLARARAIGIDDVELRDQGGGYARMGDGGAVVAMIGCAETSERGDTDVDMLVLGTPGGADPRIELDGEPTPVADLESGAVVALGDDALDAAASASALAKQLGAKLVGSAKAVTAGAATIAVDAKTPLAPELCVVVGDAKIDVAGAARLVKLGDGRGAKTADGALAGAPSDALRELVQQLERT